MLIKIRIMILVEGHTVDHGVPEVFPYASIKVTELTMELTMKRILIAVVTLTFAALAQAGQQYDVVELLRLQDSNARWIFLSGDRSELAPCAHRGGWTITNPESEVGKEQWELLKLARSLNARVLVQGSGMCSIHGYEEIKAITLRY